jgi:hypothetical protein
MYFSYHADTAMNTGLITVDYNIASSQEILTASVNSVHKNILSHTQKQEADLRRFSYKCKTS